MIDSFAGVLRDKLRIEMNNYADDVATGQCIDFVSYKHLCGVIQGLAIAERHLIDLVEKAQKGDDEDE
jgi:hypothetical protein